VKRVFPSALKTRKAAISGQAVTFFVRFLQPAVKGRVVGSVVPGGAIADRLPAPWQQGKICFLGPCSDRMVSYPGSRLLDQVTTNSIETAIGRMVKCWRCVGRGGGPKTCPSSNSELSGEGQVGTKPCTPRISNEQVFGLTSLIKVGFMPWESMVMLKRIPIGVILGTDS
jgi:hypothetical protein